MLNIKNLQVKINEKTLIEDLNLKVNPGEIHAVMGPNGAGKSTLSNVIAGYPDYTTYGEIFYNNKDLFKLSIEERALEKIFVSFQHPIEIGGISNFDFLYACYKAREEISKTDFEILLNKKLQQLEISKDFVHRNLNEGFSGGEKKKNEILQMALFMPKLSILDEIDSGLDVDALKVLTKNILNIKSPDTSIILITHYTRLLNYIKPDFVHILKNGKIIKTGNYNLALEIENKGYDIV